MACSWRKSPRNVPYKDDSIGKICSIDGERDRKLKNSSLIVT